LGFDGVGLEVMGYWWWRSLILHVLCRASWTGVLGFRNSCFSIFLTFSPSTQIRKNFCSGQIRFYLPWLSKENLVLGIYYFVPKSLNHFRLSFPVLDFCENSSA
jgi:hypothetical protein